MFCCSIVNTIIMFKTLGKGFFSGALQVKVTLLTLLINTILPNISMVEIKVYAHKF